MTDTPKQPTDQQKIDINSGKHESSNVWTNLSQSLHPQVLIQLFSIVQTLITLIASPAGQAFLAELIKLGAVFVKTTKPEDQK